jgi:DNA polymerase-3 subunit epsilon
LAARRRGLGREKIVVSDTAFDRAALGQSCAANQLAPLACRWLDSASVARRAWPAFSQAGYGLGNLAAEFGIAFGGVLTFRRAPASPNFELRSSSSRTP